jgi:tryptophan synthase alpha subunit
MLQDPLADGPVIQGAATRALEKGTTLDGVLDMVRGVAPGLKAPLVLFTYYNPIMRRGMDKFCSQIAEAGASGVDWAMKGNRAGRSLVHALDLNIAALCRALHLPAFVTVSKDASSIPELATACSP